MSEPIPLPRLVPAPRSEPPYGEPRTSGALALAYPVRREVPRRRGLVIGVSGAMPGEKWLRALGQALAEILAGRRPPESVQERMSERAYQELVRAGKMIDAVRPPMVGAPHVQSPTTGVVEMCLLVRCGPRSHALAVRLERIGTQWLVTEVETA